MVILGAGVSDTDSEGMERGVLHELVAYWFLERALGRNREVKKSNRLNHYTIIKSVSW